MSPKTLLAALAVTLAGAAFAAGDIGDKPPSKPVAPPPAKADAARCAQSAVNACRAACDSRKPDATAPKAEIAKKAEACKADCLKGC